MYGILAANFFAIRYAFPVLLWPPVSWLADGHCNMLLVFSGKIEGPQVHGLEIYRRQCLIYDIYGISIV